MPRQHLKRVAGLVWPEGIERIGVAEEPEVAKFSTEVVLLLWSDDGTWWETMNYDSNGTLDRTTWQRIIRSAIKTDNMDTDKFYHCLCFHLTPTTPTILEDGHLIVTKERTGTIIPDFAIDFRVPIMKAQRSVLILRISSHVLMPI